jgi:hypothetical protein
MGVLPVVHPLLGMQVQYQGWLPDATNRSNQKH